MDWSHLAMNHSPKHITVGKIEGKGIRGGRCRQLLDDLKEKRRYWNLKEEAQIALSGELSWKSLWACPRQTM